MDGHTLYYQDASRPAPPTGPTPMYAKFVQRYFPYSLRPVLLFSCLISLLYLLILGASEFRDAGKNDTTTKLKVFDTVEGILFMGAVGVELFGFYSAFTVSLESDMILCFRS